MQIKSPIYTILLSKSDFSFALLLVTFELLEVEQSYIPLLKALMCGINAAGAQRCGCMFTFRHAYLKMGVLLHKMAIVCNQMSLAVYNFFGSTLFSSRSDSSSSTFFFFRYWCPVVQVSSRLHNFVSIHTF